MNTDQLELATSVVDDLLRKCGHRPAICMSLEDWRLLCREAGFPGLEEQLDTIPPHNSRYMHAGDIGYRVAPEE